MGNLVERLELWWKHGLPLDLGSVVFSLNAGMIILAMVSVIVVAVAVAAGVYWLPGKGYGAAGRSVGFCLMGAGAGLMVFFVWFGGYVHKPGWMGIRLVMYPLFYLLMGVVGVVLVVTRPAGKGEAAGGVESSSVGEAREDRENDHREASQ